MVENAGSARGGAGGRGGLAGPGDPGRATPVPSGGESLIVIYDLCMYHP